MNSGLIQTFSEVGSHTFLLSLITLPIQPNPATSTTFSCQLSRTLMAAPLDSPPPGLGACCEKPVDCGVSEEEGRPKVDCRWRDVVLGDEELMPLYLSRAVSMVMVSRKARSLQIFHNCI
jgi:hypothetical protein